MTLNDRLRALARQYADELVERFKAGELTADELRAALEDVPARVYLDVVVEEDES